LKDLTSLKTFIIDSKNPKEIDDAISMEFIGEKPKFLWVHISYPAKLLKHNSEIDLECRRRVSSLYLVDDYRPMLPESIINLANLKMNKVSETLSACIEFNQNGSIKSYSIVETIIKPNYELTYEDANDILDLEPKEEYELLNIRNVLKKSFNYRKECGAITFNAPYSKLCLIDDEICFEKHESTPAHNLVSESMILMGFVISDFLIKNKIPSPFRSQKINCDANEILKRNSSSLIKYSILKQYIGRSFITRKPNKHDTLGLKSYTQVTSPLRRYIDLLIQKQLYFYLNNYPLIKEQEIDDFINEYKTKLKDINEIIRENKFLYLSKFFKKNKNELFKIIFIRWINPKKNIALVFFPEYYLEILIKLYISVDTYTNKIYKIKYNENGESNLLEFIN
tara:strand:+ start:198 stop:1385 length:1188 start_codon:yes stop_codon:yes gene_type:complete